MKWIEAVERLPEPLVQLHLKCNGEKVSGFLTKSYGEDAFSIENVYYPPIKVKWLDESPQSEQEDELWLGVYKIIAENGDTEAGLKELKKSFTISKKQ